MKTKREWLRDNGIQDNIDDLFTGLKRSGSPMADCLEDFAVGIWNMAIESAKNAADETDVDGDPAKAIAELEVRP